MSENASKETNTNITLETTFDGGTYASGESAKSMNGLATPDLPKSIKDLQDLSPKQITYLQRTIGNNALMRMMNGSPTNSAETDSTRNFASSFKMGGRTTPLQRSSATTSRDTGKDFAPVDDIETETMGFGESVERQSIGSPPPNDGEGDGGFPPQDGGGEGEKNNTDVQRYIDTEHTEPTHDDGSSEYTIRHENVQSHQSLQMKRENESTSVYPTVTFSDGKRLFLKPNEYTVVQRIGEESGAAPAVPVVPPTNPFYILPNKAYEKWRGGKKDPTKGKWVPARKAKTTLELSNLNLIGNDYEGEVAGTKVKVNQDFVKQFDANQKEIVDKARVTKDPRLAKDHRGSGRYILANKPFDFWKKDKTKKGGGGWNSANPFKTAIKLKSPRKRKTYYQGKMGKHKLRALIGDTVGGKSGWKDITATRPLFNKTINPPQPKPDDVTQNLLGDCYLLAAMSALASNATGKAQLESMMVDQGTAVSVRLYQKQRRGGYTPRYVTVNKSEAQKPTGDQLYATGALWVTMLEKAYAAGGFDGEGNRSGGRASMQDIAGGFSDEAMGVLTGEKASHKSIAGGLERNESGRKKGGFTDPSTGKAVSNDSIPWHKKHRTEYIRMAKKSAKRQDFGNLSLYTYFQSDEAATIEWGKHLKTNYKDIDGIFKARKKDLKGRFANQITVDDFKPTLNKVTNALAKTTVTKTVEKWYPGKIGTGQYSDPQNAIFTNIQNMLTQGKAVTASTQKFPAKKPSKEKGKSGGEAKVAGIVGGHAYTILEALAGTDNARQPSTTDDYRWLKIRNPWGSYSRDYDFSTAVGTAAAKQMKETTTTPDTGIFWIEFSDFTRHFNGVQTSG